MSRSGLDATTAAALQGHAARLRNALHLGEAPIVSATGLWLLLAAIGDAATDPADRAELAAALGLPPDEARAVVERLLADPHPAVGAALGGWLRADLQFTEPLRGPVPVVPLPGQAALDAWASDHTNGLIKTFPLSIDADTLMVVASALVTEPRWSHLLPTDEDGKLLLTGDLQAIVATEAAGLVGVACPPTNDGVDAISVIGAPDVAPADLWAAVDEVVAARRGGRIGHGDHPAGPLHDGHAWTIHDEIETFQEWRAPEDGAVIWTSRLPVWRAEVRHDLTDAPGVGAAARGLEALLPPHARARGVEMQCVQAALGEYDAEGFRAAAVTAMGLRAAGMPTYVDRRVRRVTIEFDRPHALVAVARGGAWEGVPLFHAWVRPPEVVDAERDRMSAWRVRTGRASAARRRRRGRRAG